MIRLVNTVGEDGVVAVSTDAPYELVVRSGKYAIVNTFTGVNEYEGHSCFVEVIALLESFEGVHRMYTKAGSVSAMMDQLRTRDQYPQAVANEGVQRH